MSETIQPSRQTVSQCLTGKTYYIDFYQREYVWNKGTVHTLLRDVFDSFEENYREYKDSELTKEVLSKFGWYYLNVIMTSTENEKVYIVDGQQRLSTLVLLCAKLRHTTNNPNLQKSLSDCIYGLDWDDTKYFIDNDKRKRAMDFIMNGKECKPPYASPTEQNLIERYKDISEYIDKLNLDDKKLTALIYFVLHKLVVVELGIIQQNDIPMVFEVINDRGEALKPFEILKGKLIGALPKTDSQIYSDKWDNALLRVKGNEDKFFQTYIRARFLSTRNSDKEMQINNAYHRYLFEDEDIHKVLKFRKTDADRIVSIKNFIDNDLEYYTELYASITNSDNLLLQYCKSVLDTDGQYQLILAACSVKDSEEKEKIQSVAKEFERLFMLLKFNGIYDSNEFREIVYKLSGILRETQLTDYREKFEEQIKTTLKNKKNIADVASVLDYNYFQKLSYETTSAFYYIFARVEDYLGRRMKKTPENDVVFMSTKHSAKLGYQIEHIFSQNDTNRSYFSSEEEFLDRRNNIGGLILMKGRDNIVSGNEEYGDKLKAYSHSTFWGQTLCENFYHDNKDFVDFNKALSEQKGVSFIAYDEFKPESMEERCKLLYELVKIIWDVEQPEDLPTLLKEMI